jgi:hypothetical protein
MGRFFARTCPRKECENMAVLPRCFGPLLNNVFETPVFIIILIMLVGYNTNISYKGTVYHVQTEDSGLRNPHIITLLYNKGTILSRKKISYANIAAAPEYKETVREMMKEQHKAMIKELIAGKHTQDEAVSQPVPEPATEAVVQPTLPPAQPEPIEVIPAPVEEGPAEPEPDKKQITKSLDDILLDYIMKEKDR